MYFKIAKLILFFFLMFDLHAVEKNEAKTKVLALIEKYLYSDLEQIKNLSDIFTNEYQDQMGGPAKFKAMLKTRKKYKKEELKIEYIPSVTGDLYMVKVQDQHKHSFLYRVRYSNESYLIDGGQEDPE